MIRMEAASRVFAGKAASAVQLLNMLQLTGAETLKQNGKGEIALASRLLDAGTLATSASTTQIDPLMD